jgi:AraC-like DNA-binding protein
MAEAQFFIGRPVTAFEIPDSLMQSPIVLARNLSTKAENFQQPIKQIGGVHSFVSSFQLAIKPYLSMGKLPISLASEILNINVRTIQRRLEKEGVIYKALIEEMVLEQTLFLLEHSDLSITDIGAKMGYSDSSHFTRAFKRQMKMTPRQYRKERKV